MSPSIKKFKELARAIYAINISYLNQYLYVMKILCNTSKLPTEYQQKTILGDEIFSMLEPDIDLSNINDINFTPMFRKINTIENTGIFTDKDLIEMQKFIYDETIIRSYYTTKISMVTLFIEDKKKEKKKQETKILFQIQLKILLSNIKAKDQYKLANSDYQNVFLLFSDGEILSTKGGEGIFLNQRLLTVEPSILGINPKLFTFPNKYIDSFYSVFENLDLAVDFRNKMIDLYKII
jgi:hypothetical protein